MSEVFRLIAPFYRVADFLLGRPIHTTDMYKRGWSSVKAQIGVFSGIARVVQIVRPYDFTLIF